MNCDAILRARALIGPLTPMITDCGALCGAACCQPDEDGQGGVYLFPGEERNIKITTPQDLAVAESMIGEELL